MDLVRDTATYLLKSTIGMTGLYATTLKAFESFVRRFAEVDGLDLDPEIAMYTDGGLGILECVHGLATGECDIEHAAMSVAQNLDQMSGAVDTIEILVGDKKIPRQQQRQLTSET